MSHKLLKDKIIRRLKESAKVTDDVIQRAEALHNEKEIKFVDALIQLNVMDEKKLLGLISLECGVPFLNLSQMKISKDMADLLPEKVARKYNAVPISSIRQRLTIGMIDPFDMYAIDDLKITTQKEIDVVMCSERDIQQALEDVYGESDEQMSEIMGGVSEEKDQTEVVAADSHEIGGVSAEETSSTPIVRIVDLILMESYKKGASDIHIEPFEQSVRVRYRIDGTLRDALTLPKTNHSALVARLKILANMDITESRIPQDGRFKIRFGQTEIDYRVSILPVYWGAKVVMRALDKSSLKLGLHTIGFSDKALNDFKSAIEKPFGMIIVTGPTGSGKSTTLYSLIWELNTVDRNIITLEDPIEYQLTGITQMQARPEIGLTFVSGLRSILRQSPDVVMVGEIRDSETADIAVKASLTGQVVLTTLHTNDAAGAVVRLQDMGVEPFLLSSSLTLVAAQRLCRKICPNCKERIDVPREALGRLGLSKADAQKYKQNDFYHGKGCDKCAGTGYRGRVAITETLVVDNQIRRLIEENKAAHEIKKAAIERGMITVWQDAINKMLEGITTVEEVFRVTTDE